MTIKRTLNLNYYIIIWRPNLNESCLSRVMFSESEWIVDLPRSGTEVDSSIMRSAYTDTRAHDKANQRVTFRNRELDSYIYIYSMKYILSYSLENHKWFQNPPLLRKQRETDKSIKQSFKQWHSDMEKNTIRWKYTFKKEQDKLSEVFVGCLLLLHIVQHTTLE